MNDFARQRRQRLIGIALMCGAVATFAFLDTTGKYLNHHMSTFQVVWARYTFGFLLTLMIFNPVSRPGLLTTRRPYLQVGRALLLLGSTLFNFASFKFLQLDQALSIVFTMPLMVAVLAGPLLGEWIGWRRWCAIGVGFAGVLLVTQPGFGGIHPAALLSLGAAACLALYGIATRVLARSDSTETTLFYSNFVGAAVMLPVVPFFWSTPAEPFVIGVMVLCGVLGSFSHYLLIAGHRLAPASVLAPFVYTQMVWAIALGFLAFGDVPTSWTLAGAAVVVASGLYLLYREHQLGKSTVSANLPE